MLGGMLGSSLIGGITSLVGGRQQARAANRAADNQMAMYQQTRDDLSPYREGGERGLDAYMSELGFSDNGYTAPKSPDMSLDAVSEGFEESPGYQYALDQMQKAVQNSAAARGNLHSGATQLELMRHANGMAAQDYWNYVQGNRQGIQDNYNMRQNRLSRLESLAGMGAQAATQTGQFGANAATNAGNFRLQGAGAMAGGLAGAANAAQAGLNNWAMYQQMKPPSGSYGPSAPNPGGFLRQLAFGGA